MRPAPAGFGPAADALDESAPVVEPTSGGVEPPPLPVPTGSDFDPESDPRPSDWVAPDTSVDDKFGIGAEFGLVAAILVSALVNAGAIWALLRYVARQAAARGTHA